MTVLQVEGENLIHGIVYNDVDGDGVMDVDEAGVPGALVTLVGMGAVETGSMNSDNGEMPDGHLDINVKFSTQEIAATLGDVTRGDVVTLTMDGFLSDGSPISGEETVWIVQVPK